MITLVFRNFLSPNAAAGRFNGAAQILFRRILCASLPLLAAFLAVISTARAEEPWQSIFDPFRVLTIHIEIDPQKWEAIKKDTNFYDPVLNIREPCKLWVTGPTAPNSPETAITVQIRRKSDPALPSDADPQKVSLKIDINEYVPGQNLFGVKKLSLENGSGNGVLEEGFAMALHRLAGEAGFYPQPCGYSSWKRLVVNGQYVGLYTSPEQRDVTFLKNRGIYRQKASWLYEINGGILLDDSVATTDSPTHTQLNFYPFRGPNNPPADFETQTHEWVDMRAMLTMAAIEGFSVNSDGLFYKSASNQGKNSFCLDFLPSKQHRRVYLPWDLDAGFGSTTFDIFAGGSGQAGQRRYQTLILQHVWFKEFFKHVFTDLLDGPFSGPALHGWLDQLEPVLGPALAEDPNCGTGQFASLRSYINQRIPNVRAQIGALVQPPIFTPPAGEIASGFQFTMSHGNTSGTTTIYYTLDGSDPRAAVVPATLAGAIAPGAAAYTGPITLNSSARIIARARNVNGSTVTWSALREAQFNVSAAVDALRVTEIMYHPKGDAAFEDADEFEFIELKNTGPTPLRLDGCRMEGIDFTFAPGATVPAGGFIVLVANPVAFSARYPGVLFNSAYFRGLSNSGEKLRMVNGDGTTVFSVDYNSDVPWPLGENGLGYSLVNRNVNGNPDDPASWRASTALHGSPGADDPAPPYGVGLVINEVLAKTNTPYEDAIEIYNPTAGAIDISGWYLSDSASDELSPQPESALKKYKIPAGTVVPAGGYKVFYEAQFNPAAPDANALSPFGLGQDGDQAYLSSADAAGNLTGHVVGAKFGASANNVPFGRYATSTGTDFTVLTVPTFGIESPASKTEFRQGTGAINAAPRIGPVVINEIMYQPPAGGAEFVELLNVTGAAVDLSGWKLGGAAFTFPAGTSVPAGGLLLLVDTAEITVSEFRAAHAVPASVPILGALFDLGNGGESLQLAKPNPDPLRPHLLVDRVRYNDAAPWPTEAAGFGPSLERIAATAYGNEPLNWRCTQIGGTPGAATRPSPAVHIARGSSWRFHASGRDLGTAWLGQAYRDNAWPKGRGVFGYGHPSVSTPIPKAITTFFRKEFSIAEDLSRIATLTLSANHHHGFVAYLNGAEVARRAMPAGAVNYQTLGLAHTGGSYEPIDLLPHVGKLNRGRNVLAVEVHLGSADATEMLWDADLACTLSTSIVADTDLDGLPDDWEDLSGLDKNNPADALLDADGDGANNLHEFIAGTDPRDPASLLRAVVARSVKGGIAVRFTTVPGKSYTVQFKNSLHDSFWVNLSTFPAGADTVDVEVEDGSAGTVTTRFYRVVTPAVP